MDLDDSLGFEAHRHDNNANHDNHDNHDSEIKDDVNHDGGGRDDDSAEMNNASSVMVDHHQHLSNGNPSVSHTLPTPNAAAPAPPNPMSSHSATNTAATLTDPSFPAASGTNEAAPKDDPWSSNNNATTTTTSTSTSASSPSNPAPTATAAVTLVPPAAPTAPTSATNFCRTIETYGGYDLRTLAAITPRYLPLSKQDLVTVDPHLVIMSLRSGLLMSQTWALNVLTALANEPFIDFPLSHHHQLMAVLFDLLAFFLPHVPTVSPSSPSSSCPPAPSFSASSSPSPSFASAPHTPAAANDATADTAPRQGPVTIHDLLAAEYMRFSSILSGNHRLHSPAMILNHEERALCIENIIRGFSFSDQHASAMITFPQFLPTLVSLFTNYPLEHRKNALVILSNVASKLMFTKPSDLDVVLAVLSDCILTQVDADRTYTYFPHPTGGGNQAKLAQIMGNPVLAQQYHQHVINTHAYFNCDPFYFHNSALETLVHLSLLPENREIYSRASVAVVLELIRKLGLLITEDLEDIEDVDTAEMALVVLSYFCDLNDELRVAIASQPALVNSLIRFARFPVLLTVHDKSVQRQNRSIMKFASQTLLEISHSRDVQLLLKDHEQVLLEATCERHIFSATLSEVLFNISKAPTPD